MKDPFLSSHCPKKTNYLEKAYSFSLSFPCSGDIVSREIQIQFKMKTEIQFRNGTMQIQFFQKSGVFKLDTSKTTTLFMIGASGELRKIYYGATISDAEELTGHAKRRDRAFSPSNEGFGPEYSLDIVPLEFSAFGGNDFRITGNAVNTPATASVTMPVYRSHKILKSKKTLPGLPASFAAKTKVQTLEIRLEDPATKIEWILSYTLFEDSDVIARSTKVRNASSAPVMLEKIMSAQLDFDHSSLEMVYLTGHWAKERQGTRRPLTPGRQGFRSGRGATGHQYNPSLALVAPETTEHAGEAYGMVLLYSGNYLVDVEVDQFSATRAMIGINPENFTWKLEAGEEFQSPEALVFFSADGLNGLSQISHSFLTEHVIRSPWKHKKRPILINNWEATYFDFNDKKIYDIAREASKLGIEMLVLDDGWFGKRDDDRSSLGDWFVNTDKLGDLGKLVSRINKLGMKFGLWFEPEMISEKSNLYAKHPEWVLQIPNHVRSLGRSQMVLDMSRPEVVDYLFDTIAGVLKSANIEYIKWDMNRNLTEVFSAALPADRQKEVSHRFVLGTYDLHERLLHEFPDLLIEGCSGGGGRFDAGMLYYVPQIWTSDDSDAMERVSIQLGTSLFYPCPTMGAHVSVCPNHQTSRTVPFETRGHVALAGTFGYELDVTKLSPEDKQTVKDQVALYHKYNDLIREGTFHRLTEGLGIGNVSAWMWVSSNKKQALVSVIRKQAQPCGHGERVRIRLRGLDPAQRYLVGGTECHGDSLMNLGIPVPIAQDSTSMFFEIRSKK